MSVDRYTKVVLTVIAVCLVWLSIGGPSLVTPVIAQQSGLGADVILKGWADENGTVRRFPEPVWARQAKQRNPSADVTAAEALPTTN